MPKPRTRRTQPQKTRQRSGIWAASILLVLFSIVLLLALIPGQHRFETRLIASQMSFTTDEPKNLFLNRIRGISEVVITGQHTESWTLSGAFTGDDRFDSLPEIEIELPNQSSQIILRSIAPAKPNPSDAMELTELQLQNQTRVQELSYIPSTRKLELTFEHTELAQPPNTSLLKLYLGNQPLELVLEEYRIPKLGLEDTIGTEPLRLRYVPDIKELQRSLPVSGLLSVKLPANPSAVDASEWFWGNIQVKAVKFLREQRIEGATGGEELVLSAIREGKVRMVDQELTIEPDQFLTVDAPGIQRIRHMQVSADKGLEVQAVGKASQVQVGLDPEFPIREIRSNLITQWVPSNTMIAIVSFCGAMVSTLLAWLVDNFFKRSDG